MANVLPVKDRKALAHSYWLRLAITAAFLTTAAMTIGTVSLIPSYLAARTEFAEVMRYQEVQGDTREAAKNDTAVQTARVVNSQIATARAMEEITSPAQAIQYVMRDWEVHAEHIIISGFTYSLVQDKKETTPQLRVSGEARSRSALNGFVQTLRANSLFSTVTFPVSDLAGEGVVDFSLTVQFDS